jgi:hypothetical protein
VAVKKKYPVVFHHRSLKVDELWNDDPNLLHFHKQMGGDPLVFSWYSRDQLSSGALLFVF